MIEPMKLNQKLTTKQFILSHLLILAISLIFLSGLYYILDIQYRKPSNPFLNGPVTTPPKSLMLNLEQPDQDTLSYTPSIVVSGKTGSSKDVLISTAADDFIIQSKLDGSFSTVLNLVEGVNRITVAVFDATGEMRSANRTIYYSKEKL